jgi:hypothetical protein
MRRQQYAASGNDVGVPDAQAGGAEGRAEFARASKAIGVFDKHLLQKFRKLIYSRHRRVPSIRLWLAL